MHGTLFAVGTREIVAVIMAVLGTYSVVNQQPSGLHWPGREGASNACGSSLASLPSHCDSWAWRHEDGGVLLVQVAVAFATPMMPQPVAFVKEKAEEELSSAVLGDSGRLWHVRSILGEFCRCARHTHSLIQI